MRIRQAFDEDQSGFLCDLALEIFRLVGVGEMACPAERAGERIAELSRRAAVKFLRGDEFIACVQQRAKRQHVGGKAGGRAGRAGAAFQHDDFLLKGGYCRIGDAGVYEARLFQREYIGGVPGVAEYERAGLVDRRAGRARCRVGRGAAMDGQCFEFQCVVFIAHRIHPFLTSFRL